MDVKKALSDGKTLAEIKAEIERSTMNGRYGRKYGNRIRATGGKKA